MSNKNSFSDGLNEDLTNNDFIKFVEEFNDKKFKESVSENNTMVLWFSGIVLTIGEYLLFNQDFLSDKMKWLAMGQVIILCLMICGKELFHVLSSNIGKKERKRDLKIFKEKNENWLLYLNEKENKFKIARSLIKRIENLEELKINNKEDLNQEMRDIKEYLYNIFGNEIKEEHFYHIYDSLKKIDNIECKVRQLKEEEEKLNKIKEEINNTKNKELSNSFNGESKKVSFK